MSEKSSKDNSGNSSERKSNSVGNMTESERELAQNALNEFNKSNFSAAVSLIGKLQATRPKDIKVLSNKAVSEYYANGLSKTEAFKMILSEICDQGGIKINEIKPPDEVEASVIRLNFATVNFHIYQLHEAKKLLEEMYKGLESLEESISIGLCLLLVEVLFELSLPGRAASVVVNTEATFLPQPLPPQTSSTKQIHVDKDSRSPDKSTAKENLSNAMSTRNTSASSYNRTNILNSHATNDSITGSSEMRCSADQEILRGKLQIFRVRSLLQMRILRVAKKELKACLNHAVTAGNSLNSTLIMLKSQLEYLKGGYKKAMKVLQQCSNLPTPSSYICPSPKIAFNNNMGILYASMQMPTVGATYIRNSLLAFDKEMKEYSPDNNPLTCSLYMNNYSTGIKILYNLGLTLLMKEKYEYAFGHFLEVAKFFPNNPRLWFRMAECCIGSHRKALESENDDIDLHTADLGRGRSKNILIKPIINPNAKKSIEQPEAISQGSVSNIVRLSLDCEDQTVYYKVHHCQWEKIVYLEQTGCNLFLKLLSKESAENLNEISPEASLEYARVCLKKALLLIPENASPQVLTEEQEATGVLPELYPSGPSCPMKGVQVIKMKLRILACSAYVALCLDDFNAALKEAQLVLSTEPQLPQGDPVIRLHGHLYAGEALIHLGRISEALTHFDPKLLTGVELEPQSQIKSLNHQEYKFPGKSL
ncbi:CCR4-NOT transcription complex subunit 10 [Armadillidium nasatum]|uniref:CCR4-NOT transcription complex subunit 10 n=1 Tax=Armadillidium nasatum TaxID=96803 RepID=A0A5N5TP31_9CRUS|nr:CCR4-NOT transcription complex subunit 10 [Armadillidium nasatum]